MKLIGPSLSPALVTPELLAQALEAAAAVLRGGVPAGRAPVAAGSTAVDPLLTVQKLINEFLFARAKIARSDRYIRQLRVSLRSFGDGRFRTPLDQVNVRDVEKWIDTKHWKPKTIRNYLGDIRTLFNFAKRRGYVDRNPGLGVELPPLDKTEKVEIHTPDQVRQVLECARRADLDIMRHLAVRYFAGLRSAEAHRLREEDLKLDQNLIEVPAEKAKTRSRRLVNVQPNLAAWLALGGELRPMSEWTVCKFKKLTAVVWPHNVTRHSFISYHIAHWKKANETAMDAGTSEQLVFSTYRALVTPALAAEYWSIVPK
jgi:integrase